jgi:hypothetical protein
LDIYYAETLHTIAGLFKFSEVGELIGSEFYSDHFESIFRPISFIEIEDGFAVAGTSGPTSSYMGDVAAFLKTDETGRMQWYKEYNFGDYDNSDNRMEAVCKTNDGGFILTGWGSGTSHDYWMIKTDSIGNELWNKTFGGSEDDYGHNKDCYQTKDGGFVMGDSALLLVLVNLMLGFLKRIQMEILYGIKLMVERKMMFVGVWNL